MASATAEAVKVTSPDCPILPNLLREAFLASNPSDGMGSIDFGPDGLFIKGVHCKGRLKVHFVPRTNASYNAPTGEKAERDWFNASVLGAQDGRSLTIRLRGAQLYIRRSAAPAMGYSKRSMSRSAAD